MAETTPPDSDTSLSSQERRLIALAEKGEKWEPEDFEGKPANLDPEASANWADNRVIRAKVIRYLLCQEVWPTETKTWPLHMKGLSVCGAKILGPLDLEAATIAQQLRFDRCVFDSEINLSSASTKTVEFSGSSITSLNAYGAIIKGNLNLCDGFRSNGPIDISFAKVAGSVNCSDGKFNGSEGRAMDATRVLVEGSVYMRRKFEAKGEIRLFAAHVKGQIDCSDGRFENEGGMAIELYSADIGSDLFFRDKFSSVGEVGLLEARIGGQMSCEGGTFENADGIALMAAAAHIRSGVYLRGPFKANGQVCFTRTAIEGDFDCGGAEFANKSGTALEASNLSVSSTVYLRRTTVSAGGADFSGATIKGSMRCNGSTFINEGKNALNLSQVVIGAGLFLCDLRPPAKASGGIVGRLVLDQTKCYTFSDDRKSWPQKNELVLDGFAYERFQNCETDWRTRRDWLNLQPGDHLKKSFRPHPWTQVVNVLRAMGHEGDAREIAMRRELVRARSNNTTWIEAIWLYVLWAFVGNGYKPWRALGWSIGFVLFGWFAFTSAAMQGYMAPRDGNVRVSDDWNKHRKLPTTYPAFNGIVYALDAYLPVIEFEQDESWEPSVKPTIQIVRAPGDWTMLSWTSRLFVLPQWFFAEGWHRVLYWTEEFLGWVFVSLFIAGMSGVMKKE